MTQDDHAPEQTPATLEESSNEQLLAMLLQSGLSVPEGLARELVLRGDAVVGALCEILLDERRWEAVDDEAAFWASVHALYLLGAIRSPRAAPALVELLRRDPGWDFVQEAVPTGLGSMGPAALETLEPFIRDRDQRPILRGGIAVSAAVRIGHDHPEARSRIVQLLVALLAEDADPDLNAFLISRAACVDDAELKDAISEAFARESVSPGVVTPDNVTSIRRAERPWYDRRAHRELLTFFTPRNLAFLEWITEEPDGHEPENETGATPSKKDSRKGRRGRKRKRGRR